MQLRSQSRPREDSGGAGTRGQGYQDPQLKPCSQLSEKPGYEDVTRDEESHLTPRQGELNLRLYYAKIICSFPFFLSLSVVLREVLIAAGSSVLPLLMHHGGHS